MRSNEEVIKLIKSPKNRNLLLDAMKDEEMISAFATGECQDSLMKHYKSLFDINMADAIDNYFEVHTKPLLSPITGSVYTHFNKVTETSDGQRYEPSFGDDNELFSFLDTTHSWDFFEDDYISLALYRPNTRMILEMPSDASIGDKPYIAIAPVSSIHDIEEDEDGTDYLIIKDENTFYYYDEYRYAKFEKQVNTGNVVFIDESFHDFKATPVRAISSMSKYTSGCVVKKSVVVDSLPDLYAWNLMKNMAKMYRWQNGLPLHFGLSKACKERHETGVMCDNGYFRILVSNGEKDKYQMRRCPECAKRAKSKMRFGKQVEMDYQDLVRAPEIANTLKNAFGYVPSDVKLLEFNEDDLQKWMRQIESNIIGKPFNFSQSRDAKNLYQVEVETDNQRQTLAVFANELERAFEWHDSILAYSQYPSFQSLSVFLGRGFFVSDEKREIDALKELTSTTGDTFLILDKLKDYASATFQYSEDSKYLHSLFLACIPFIDVPTEIFVKDIDKFMSIDRKATITRLNSANWIAEFLAGEKSKLLASSRRELVKINTIKKFFNSKYDKYEAELSDTNTGINGTGSSEQSMDGSPSI